MADSLAAFEIPTHTLLAVNTKKDLRKLNIAGRICLSHLQQHKFAQLRSLDVGLCLHVLVLKDRQYAIVGLWQHQELSVLVKIRVL